LLMKLLAREDPHPALWDAYAATLGQLGGGNEAAALRSFELQLLREIGLLPSLSQVTATQQRVLPLVGYGLSAEAGVVVAAAGAGAAVTGSELLALQAALDANDLDALRSACSVPAIALRRQLRDLLAHHLGTSRLRTREVLLDLQPLTAP